MPSTTAIERGFEAETSFDARDSVYLERRGGANNKNSNSLEEERPAVAGAAMASEQQQYDGKVGGKPSDKTDNEPAE